jgi:hypothetical protein
MPDFLDGGGFGGAFGGGFGDLLAAEAIAMVIELAQILEQVANFLWAVLVAVANFLYGLVKTVGNFLFHIFHEHIFPIFRTLVNDYLKLKAFLTRVFQPLINVITRIRNWYIIHILPWQKLVQEIIQRVRIVLALLRLLHVKWAAKLDADLAKIQGYVTQSIQLVLGTLNQVSTILGIVIDPLMILRRDFFLSTIFSHLAALKRAVGYGNGRDLTASEAEDEQNDKQLLDPAHPFATKGAGGGVTLSPAFQTMQTNFKNAANDYMPGVALN